jgi:hypothetical protein
MKSPSPFFWKLRCARRIHALIGLNYWHSWHAAGTALRNVNHDLSTCPNKAAQAEYDAWMPEDPQVSAQRPPAAKS